ncbi:Hsp20/alpha crystallin family protein [Micromonospora sp. NPDC048930]|uniref:Hsp20/alpha crystallin family protein n=1 Tax=Micromonospora sp. NPDC048930 TaxID=3364261 RepID=UPI003716CAC8
MTLPVLRPTQLRSAENGGALDPLREMAQLHQRISQLMSAVLGADPLAGTTQGWTPLADVTETDDAYLIDIEVPGVNRKDLTVEVAGTELRVSGEIVEKEKVGWLRHRTRRVGQFAYRTTLPGDIDAEHITANLADGVLTVRVPKTETAKPRRITVNAT